MTARAPRRPLRRCTCRVGCLTLIVPGDTLTATGALTDHAAAVDARADATPPAAPYSPLSRLTGVGGVPRRL